VADRIQRAQTDPGEEIRQDVKTTPMIAST
jgi:hypothetical protein